MVRCCPHCINNPFQELARTEKQGLNFPALVKHQLGVASSLSSISACCQDPWGQSSYESAHLLIAGKRENQPSSSPSSQLGSSTLSNSIQIKDFSCAPAH